MLSSRAIFVLGKFFHLLGNLSVLPYSWNPITQTLQKCEINRKRSMFMLKTYFWWFFYVFLCCIYYSHERDLKRFNQCYLFFIAGALASMCFLIIHSSYCGGLIMFNTVLQYSGYIGKSATNTLSKNLNSILIVIKFLSFFS